MLYRCLALPACLFVGAIFTLPAPCIAQDTVAEKPKVDAGQADLDEAVIMRIDARSKKELESVSKLLKAALKKGLSDENKSFAKKMLGSVLLQESRQLAGEMLRARGNTMLQLRDDTLEKLQEAVRQDPGLIEAYLMMAKLNLGRGGDKAAVYEATSKAIDLLEDDPIERSAALVLRAMTYDADEDEKRMADLNAAVDADKENLEALQARAAMLLKTEDVEGAVKDLQLILTKDPTNRLVAEQAVQKLVELDRVEDATKLVTQTLEASPNEGMYRMRAILYRMAGKEDEALADLNQALKMQPRDPMSLMQRAEIALGRNDIVGAKRDLKAATRLAPQVANLDQAIFIRCLIAIEEKRMADAINDMVILVERAPDNTMRVIQLSRLYVDDQRPRKAIDVLTTALDRDPKNVDVLRARADALLGIGDHVEAIEDYESAITSAESAYGEGSSDPDLLDQLTGLLNNLAWVLATSPNDDIRNGKRAVELSERAVELGRKALAAAETDEERKRRSIAHVLSTLAAAYAETGDFDKAIEWSSKCVEMGKAEEHRQLEQLEEELESYQKGEPWREKQETEENDVPILSPDDLIDT